MQVALISHTPNPELLIASAARVSSTAARACGISGKLTSDQVAKLLHYLLSAGHLSPFEHASFTFAIEGISRAASHQLVRHRLASFTQQSQRYVAFQKLDYITPHTIATLPELEVKYRQFVESSHQLYCQMMEQGIPAEDARYILPQAAETQLVMTMNARELMYASSLRLCRRAQWEILRLFEVIKEEVEKVAPLIAAELNAKCYRLGYCDEVDGCGRFPKRETT